MVNLTKKAEVIKEYIDAEDIARTVEIWTGIKLDKIMEKEREKLISLPIILSEKIKGQSKAVTLVSDAI